MSKKVMIVEDNELNLKLFTDLLRAHQFIVEGVRDGRWRWNRRGHLRRTSSSWTFNCRMSAAST
jgi:CheY-like chemotaxis protein